MTRQNLWIYAALLTAIFGVYGQVHTFDFVNYDDPSYVTDNPHVRAGLTSSGFVWAFRSTEGANWFPLTRLSHMLDCQLFGLASGWHHLTNVLLHALGSLLLFALLKRMTGAVWPSALAAFAFALHPLHVESVAWVAERKDVLSTLFWFLTIWVYLNYVDRRGILRYLLVLLMFSCGLMSKPMIVTLPLVLLLIDFWPLNRRNWIEKLPLFALSAIGAAVTYLFQERGGAVASLDQLPVAMRIGNALVSYVVYLVRFFWPANLAVFYPFPDSLPAWQVLLAAFILAAITAAALPMYARRPYLAIGWLWYLITLAPVIGLVQIGLHSHADRYTYVPMVGISIMLAWGLRDIGKPVFVAAAAVACVAWLAVTWLDLGYWRNSTTLFQRAIQVTAGNYVAYNNLGVALRRDGRIAEAVTAFQDALRIRPQYGDAQSNLGEALLSEGRIDEAAPHIQEALRLRPDSPEAHINFGAVLNKRGQFTEAEAQYRRALQLQATNAEALCGLGVSLTEQGRLTEALPHLTEAVRIKPEYADAHYNLGRLFGLLGRTDEAIGQFSATVRLQPANAEAHYNLGTAYAAEQQLGHAIEEFHAAVRLKPNYVNARFNLGSALASLGRYEEAIAEFTEVLRLKPDFPEAHRNLEACLALRDQR